MFASSKSACQKQNTISLDKDDFAQILQFSVIFLCIMFSIYWKIIWTKQHLIKNQKKIKEAYSQKVLIDFKIRVIIVSKKLYDTNLEFQ